MSISTEQNERSSEENIFGVLESADEIIGTCNREFDTQGGLTEARKQEIRNRIEALRDLQKKLGEDEKEYATVIDDKVEELQMLIPVEAPLYSGELDVESKTVPEYYAALEKLPRPLDQVLRDAEKIILERNMADAGFATDEAKKKDASSIARELHAWTTYFRELLDTYGVTPEEQINASEQLALIRETDDQMKRFFPDA